MKYICNRCNKVFGQKSNYVYHVNRKRPCKPEIVTADTAQRNPNQPECSPDPTQNNPKATQHECPWCLQGFKHKHHLKRHVDTRCKMKASTIGKLQEENTLLKRQYDDLKEMMQRILRRVDACGSTEIVTNNITNTINQTFNIIPFGSETTNKLTPKEINDILRVPPRAINKYVKYVHFNKRIPEHHNVCVSNLRGNSALVFEGDKWNAKDLDDVIESLIAKGIECCRVETEKPDVPHITKFFMNQTIDQLEEDKETSSKIQKKTRKDVKHVLYNNKDLCDVSMRLGSHCLPA